MSNAVLLEIGAVARELGVRPGTLRTWERRYRVVVPRRGANGQRLYDPDQIVVLRRILAQVRRGARARAAHDIAVAPRPTRTLQLGLAPGADAPQLARRAIDTLLDKLDNPSLVFSLRLIASELVKNAVLYGSAREPIRLGLKLFPGWAELELDNRGGRLRITSLKNRREHGGRGLEIVDALTDSWSIDTGPLGTKITVRLPINPA